MYIVFENVDGLATKSDVTSNGLKIGTVDKLELFKNKVLATISLDKEVKIPRNAAFTINSLGLRGTQNIAVAFDSNANSYYADQDTVTGQLQNSFFSEMLHSQPDSTTIKNLQQLADTIAKAIREFRKPSANDNEQ